MASSTADPIEAKSRLLVRPKTTVSSSRPEARETARAAAVKDGRRRMSAATAMSEAILEGVEHAVTLAGGRGVGGPAEQKKQGFAFEPDAPHGFQSMKTIPRVTTAAWFRDSLRAEVSLLLADRLN